MELENGNKFKFIVCIYEGLGTAILLISINWSLGSPTGIAAAIMICIITIGWASGGHYNPAVTLGVLVKETLSKEVGLKKNIWFAILIILS